MSGKPKVHSYKKINRLVNRLRDDLNGGGQDFILLYAFNGTGKTLMPAPGKRACNSLYAFNGTGKTRLSMAFKEAGKRGGERDTLYFNAFTEDLFTWDNDLAGDSLRGLKMNSDSRFLLGVKELEMENRIRPFLNRYADFGFTIDYEAWTVSFSGQDGGNTQENIKISRGEENIFIWCFFLAIAQLAIDGAEAYSWVKYIYIDDPISSLDDNNAIAVASDLVKLLLWDEVAAQERSNLVKTVISSHHGLFFNVMCNELKKKRHKTYFLHKSRNADHHTLRTTDDTPFFHHVATLSELQQAAESGNLYTYHFNMLRSIMEKTATFFGSKEFSSCVHGVDDEVLYARALNLLSHGKYSVYEPQEMVQDTKDLFKRILNAFLERYQFDLPELAATPITTPTEPS